MRAADAVYDPQWNDPTGRLIDRAGLQPEELAQIGELMRAMGRLRDVERRLSEAARRYMRLNETDMRALHFLIVQRNQGRLTTPSLLARHLGITTASTTKMLDRLEQAGHVVRSAHPTDRRGIAVEITAETALAAEQTVGRQHAHRFAPAAELTAAERAVVINFLVRTSHALEEALGESPA
ncbi:MarR family winged helix-turn-helix transcriptional regulator [Microlunatus elymi]|uniref:MarR family winged helix-turn-helix transcriptional regulator n=1 Tax=Microlunatus elymi TaxID=2596828 RepID=UPI001AF01B7B|nr:MarR family transcriptional regulator [Microlunatus elymi]